MNHSIPGLPVHQQFPEFTQTHVHWVGDAIQSSHPLLSPSPPALNLSQHQGLLFSNESALCIRWPKYWSFSVSISPSTEYSGLISFRMDWLDLLAVQGTLKSLPQHHSSKASLLQCSAFFIVQLSHPYMTTGKIMIRAHLKQLWLEPHLKYKITQYTENEQMSESLSFGSLRSRAWVEDLSVSSLFETEKAMATHSSVLAWRIPGTEEPGGLPFMGSHRVGHDWSDLAAAAAAAVYLRTDSRKLQEERGETRNRSRLMKSTLLSKWPRWMTGTESCWQFLGDHISYPVELYTIYFIVPAHQFFFSFHFFA